MAASLARVAPTDSHHRDQEGWHEKLGAQALVGQEVLGSLGARYCAQAQVPPRFCGASFLLRAVPSPADTLSIGARGGPVCAPVAREWLRKKIKVARPPPLLAEFLEDAPGYG